jgi:hypothetical protein
LIAKYILDTKKKYSFGTSLDITNIQDIGIALSVSETIRNVFGAETLEASVRATLHLEI